MEYNEKIKEYRIRAGMTQQQLADRISVTRQSVARWENGWNVPTLFYAQKLADVFGVDVSTLMNGDEPPREAKSDSGSVPSDGVSPRNAPPARDRTPQTVFSAVWVCALSVALLTVYEIIGYVLARAIEKKIPWIALETLNSSVCGILMILLALYWVLKLIKTFCALDDGFSRYREYRVWNVGLYFIVMSAIVFAFDNLSYVALPLPVTYVAAAAVTLPIDVAVKFAIEKALKNRMTVTRNRALDIINLTYSIFAAVCILALAAFMIYSAVMWYPTDGLAVGFAILIFAAISAIIMLSYAVVRIAVRKSIKD